ncbi:MAG: uracil-DNA glycosylase [Clostridia bacterium]|nr:uracil-DNA glycosylase [Clostridia bacterium]
MILGTVNCQKCLHYYITWDPKFPYGCKLFGVKSRQAPSVIVYQSLGKACENYKENEKKA